MKIQNIKLLVSTVLISFFSNSIQAQGCSDAGFCSVSNGFINQDEPKKNNLETGFVYGVGEEDVTNYVQYLSYTRSLGKQLDVSAKITSAIAVGSFGTRGNIGDVFVTGNYRLKAKIIASANWSLFLGAKIPLTQGNDKINGFALPMPYQSSLGTFDAIGGVNLVYKKWDFNTSFQIPLSQNKNSFISQFSGTNKFVSTNLFERKPDVLFRSGYKIRTTNKKFTFKPNVLFIYHLGEDSFENIFGQRQNIKNSDGLTLNGNLIVTYKLGAKSYLETSLASPFVVRDERPDGLTRAFTMGLSYKVNF